MVITGSIIVTVIALLSAFFDWNQRMIPNWLTGGGIFLGLLFSTIQGTFGSAMLGIGSACLLLIPYKRGWLGGGDVKLLMAYGTLLGAWLLLDLWTGAALLSIPMVLLLAYQTKCPFRRVSVPYAVPLAVMALCIVGRGLLHV
jgi:Flp pilus assembly protein protease CpaA